MSAAPERTGDGGWVEAIDEERRQIQTRRAQVFGEAAAPLPEPADPSTGPVGLALSGGGVRSAAFNLGLIQALHKSGLLRWIDYLSCVSGGSYAGAMVSEAIQQKRQYGRNTFLLATETDDVEGPTVRRATELGNYLFRLDLMANRYMIGLLLNLLPIISAMIAIGAGLAWAFRWLDTDGPRDCFAALGFNNDYVPALFPAIAAFSIWFVVYSLALLIRSEPLRRATHYLFASGVACLLVAVIILLGNGDITLQLQTPGMTRLDENRVQWPSAIYWIVVGLGGLGLLPLVVPKELIRSGQNPRHPIESWIFYYTSFVLFLGIPLTFVWWFGRENVSGYATYRGPDLQFGDVINREGFLQLLEQSEESPGVQPWYGAALTTSLDSVRGLIPEFWHAARTRTEPSATLIEFVDLPVTAEQGAEKNEATTRLVGRLRIGHEHASALHSAAQRLEASDRRVKRAEYQLSLGSEFPAEGLREHGTLPRNTDWFDWRYLARFQRYGSALIAPFHASQIEADMSPSSAGPGAVVAAPPLEERAVFENDFREHWAASASRRKAEQELLECFNQRLNSGLNPLIEFSVAPSGAKSIVKLPAAKLPKPVVDQLLHLAVNRKPNSAVPVRTSPDPSQGLSDERQRGELNRAILEAAFPTIFRPRTELRRVTLIGKDQFHRGLWCLIGVVVWIVSSATISPNVTSLHEWYRDRLAAVYLPFTGSNSDDPFPDDQSSKLHELKPHLHGGPFPLFVASSSLESPLRHARQLDPDFKSFVMTPLTCGSRELGVRPTDDRSALARLTVADAMAISAAALSPNYFVHHIVMALMSLANLRLGLWLPNPAGRASSYLPPTVLRLTLDEWRAHRRERAARSSSSQEPAGETSSSRDYLLVTDGGHHENLGLEALLERRCSLIIVSDAGADPLHTYDDFTRLQRRCTAEMGIRFLEPTGDDTTLQPMHRLPRRKLPEDASKDLKKLANSVGTLMCEPSTPETPENSKRWRHFFVARFRYPATAGSSERREGLLVYLKPCLTGDEDATIRNFAANNELFPHEPTTDQAFSFAQFEAYRLLGRHTGEDLAAGSVRSRGSATNFWDEESMFNIETLRDHFSGTSVDSGLEGGLTGGKPNDLGAQVDQLWKAATSGVHDSRADERLARLGGSSLEATNLILKKAVEQHWDEVVPPRGWFASQPGGWFRNLALVISDSATSRRIATLAAEWIRTILEIADEHFESDTESVRRLASVLSSSRLTVSACRETCALLRSIAVHDLRKLTCVVEELERQVRRPKLAADQVRVVQEALDWLRALSESQQSQ